MFSLRLRDLIAAVLVLSLISGLTPFEPLALVGATDAEAQTSQGPQGRYEIKDQRGTYSKTFQEPDGKLTAEISTMPLHFRAASGQWEEIDNTLVADGNGYTNAASAMDIDFAGAATEADIIEVGYEQRSIGLGLIGATDVAPVVDGSSITYPEILPGADLRFDIYGESIKESLILKRAPKLPGKDLELRFPLKAHDLSASVVNGEVVLTDAAGAVQLTIPEMFMFDSSGSGAAAEPARSPISFTLETTGNAQHLKVLVDGAWLKDPARVYPVTIDPSITGRNPNLDTFVQSNLSSGQNLSSSLSSGTPDGGVTKARALVKFDLTDIPAGSTVSSATLSMWENHSFSCTASRVDVYRVDTSWTSSVTWANKPTFAASPADSKTVAKGFSSSCAAGWVDFNVASPVQYIKSANATNEGFGIRAYDETVSQQWKKFAAAEGGNPPKLSVTYQTTPNLPPLSSPANGATNVSQLPTLKAVFSDANPADQGHVNFQVWLASQCSGTTQSTCSGTPVAWAAGSVVTAGQTSTLTLSSPLVESSTYKWTGRGYDGNSYGPWANLWSFTTADDLIAPAAPVASSETHPTEGTWYTARDVRLRWTEPYDVSGIKGYSSVWDTSPTTEPPTSSSITGNVSLWYGVADGTHWLHVKAQDKANPGNWSATEHFRVNIDGTPPEAPTISLQSTHPDENRTYSSDDPVFEWSATDTSPIAGYSYLLDQQPATIPDQVSEGTATTKTYVDIPTGTSYFHVRAVNGSGLWGNTKHFKVTVDSDAPPAPVFREEPFDPSSDSTPTWTFASTDETTDANTFQCQLARNTLVTQTWQTCISPFTTDVAPHGAGVYELSVRELDLAGNWSIAETSGFSYDPVVPNPPIITEEPTDPTANRMLSFSFSGNLGLSFECQLSNPTGTVSPYTPCSSPFTYDTTGLSDGMYTFRVRTVDLSQNHSASVASSVQVNAAAATGEIGEQLFEEEADTVDAQAQTIAGLDHAGSWQTYNVDGTINLKVAVADLTSSGEAAIEALSTSAVGVDAVAVTYSTTELEDFSNSVSPTDSTLHYVTSIDVVTNTVEVEVEDASGTATGTPSLQLGTGVPPDAIVASWTRYATATAMETRVQYPPYRAGKRWRRYIGDEGGEGYCTLGFVFEYSSGGKVGSSASHCAPNDTRAWSGSNLRKRVGTVFSSPWSTVEEINGQKRVPVDVSLIRIGKGDQTPTIIIDGDTYRTVREVDRRIRRGQRVCMSGMVSGIECGEIKSQKDSLHKEGPNTHVWEDLWCADLDVRPGDSGSPVYVPAGRVYDPDLDRTFYYARAVGIMVAHFDRDFARDYACFEGINQVENHKNAQVYEV